MHRIRLLTGHTMFTNVKIYFIPLLAVVLPALAFAKPQDICVYQTKTGEIRQASSLREVPHEYKSSAQCRSGDGNNYLAKPEEIELDGNIRTEQLNSTVGTIKLRWPRKVESLFGRTPLRAMTDSANTLGRALKNNAFPIKIQNLNMTWNVVFMDESMPKTQIPTSLVTNCHPGWMTPPANIYIVSERVAGGCGANRSTASVADATLSQVLIHEMGHAVEFYMLDKDAPMDKVRAEGFATWFERYASQYSSILNAGQITRQHFEAARYAIRQSPNVFSFQGSFEDYARASLYFSAMTSPRGLQGLTDVYTLMNAKGLPLIPAILSEFSWDERRLYREIEQILR